MRNNSFGKRGCRRIDHTTKPSNISDSRIFCFHLLLFFIFFFFFFFFFFSFSVCFFFFFSFFFSFFFFLLSSYSSPSSSSSFSSSHAVLWIVQYCVFQCIAFTQSHVSYCIAHHVAARLMLQRVHAVSRLILHRVSCSEWSNHQRRPRISSRLLRQNVHSQKKNATIHKTRGGCFFVCFFVFYTRKKEKKRVIFLHTKTK